MPTLAWACFSENFAAWPRKRGHGTRYTKVRCALAAKNAILEHKQKGQPLVVWRNGKTVLIPPEELDPVILPK
jgi:hypothetical protein